MATRGRPKKFAEPLIKRQYDLPKSLYERLEKEARPTKENANGRDMVDIVREALQEKFEKMPLSDQAVLDETKAETEKRLASQGLEISDYKQWTPEVGMREVMKETLIDVIRESGLVPLGRVSADEKPIVTVRLWETMKVPCGEAMSIEELFDSMGEPNELEINGRLAELATPNSWVARASGWSMCGADDDDLDGINHDDRILLTPFNEYTGELKPGMAVLVKLRYKNGTMKCTLKTYQGKSMKAKNPRFKGVDFGDKNIVEATAWAVCRGVVEKVFG